MIPITAAKEQLINLMWHKTSGLLSRGTLIRNDFFFKMTSHITSSIIDVRMLLGSCVVCFYCRNTVRKIAHGCSSQQKENGLKRPKGELESEMCPIPADLIKYISAWSLQSFYQIIQHNRRLNALLFFTLHFLNWLWHKVFLIEGQQSLLWPDLCRESSSFHRRSEECRTFLWPAVRLQKERMTQRL